MGNTGSFSCGPREESLHSTCKGKWGIALESQEGNRESRRVEGGILRSFLSWGRKPWVPSTCDGDLRELLKLSIGSKEYCEVRSVLSGLHWIWCGGRGPHLELRQEPQCFPPVLTWVSGCVCRFKQGVRSQSVWRHGALLSSRIFTGVSGLQAS